MSTTAEDRTGVTDRRAAAEQLATTIIRRLRTTDPVWPVLDQLTRLAAEDGTRPLANSALELLETGCAAAEDALSGDDVATAMQTLVALCQALVGLLEPYAGPREARPLPVRPVRPVPQGVNID